ncbi:MAG: M23 family metallopeptidase [Elusimicrobiota bacterium]|jgi:murein DD-endopeptidase MepM/ murein hydrolase activator NlpD|nr:M23 family metallopeptidase [Elusimicrobiota bacterium]
MKNRPSFYRIFFERIEIAFMPRYGRGMRFSFYPWLAFLLIVLWLALTVYAVFIVSQNIDYKITKADSKLMKTKLALIAEELTRNRKYMKLVRDTDKQMRQMLGMQANMPGGINNGKESREITFRDIFSKNTEEINEKEFADNLANLTQQAERSLASFQEIAWFYANRKNISDATPSIKPVSKGRMTSGFGYRLSPFGTYLASYHYGLDFAGSPNSKISVTADGVVRQTGWAAGYGQAVLVDHGFGYSTLYGHLADIRVKKGDKVKRGQVIANMGTTGRSTGVHLHYEVWKDGVPVNPKAYFK